MLDDVLEAEDYDKLLYNETVLKCPRCEFTATTVGGLNYHIGKNHLGEAKLIRNKPLPDKMSVPDLFPIHRFNIHLKTLYCSI